MGLALALAAWEKARGLTADERAPVGITLAWAYFANGKDSEALAQSRATLALAPSENKLELLRDDLLLRRKVAAGQSEDAAEDLEDLRASLATLEADIDRRRTYRRFPDESQRFLHDALTQLLLRLDDLQSKECVDVARRLTWARRIGALTQAHPGARVTWQEARAAIALADGIVASALYLDKAIELRPDDVMGLVPIGMNPVTRLWEFYDLRSAWDGTSDLAAIAIPQHVLGGDRAGDIEVEADTGIIFVLLPGGTCWMGTQATGADATGLDGQPEGEASHRARLAPFFVARHELTQGQWQRLTERETQSFYHAGSTPQRGPGITATNPMENVSWIACDTLLTWHGMVLPSEAQWEYACRAGTTTPWSCAFAELARHANLADAASQAYSDWPCEAWEDRFLVHAAVGSFRPNAFGLFDVHGNVAEWTRDSDLGSRARPRDGDGMRAIPGAAMLRVYRGGSYADAALTARSATRGRNGPHVQGGTIGVGPARMLRL